MVVATLQQNLWKIIAAVGGTCVLMAAHSNNVPVLLKPYEGWIEAVSFVWTMVHAVMMTPSPSPDPKE